MVLTIISVVFSISLYKSAQKTRYSTQNLQSLEEKISQMEQETIALEETLVAAQQPFNQEKIIRDELLMKKPGEYIVQIPDDLTYVKKTLAQTELSKPWEEWKELLF